MRRAGRLRGTGSSGQAKLVRASHQGGPPVTDGVFPEAKEFLAGYWIVDVTGRTSLRDRPPTPRPLPDPAASR